MDDAQGETREPSHSDLGDAIARASLSDGAPRAHGRSVGKAKRMRDTLRWALDNAPNRGEELVASLVALVRGLGGFRPSSPNYVGEHHIQSVRDALKAEGYVLTDDGELGPVFLASLSGVKVTESLNSYVQRAKRGSTDAALLVGTGKDLLEATAAHVLTERFNSYSMHSNFPTLLGQAFLALDLSTPANPPQKGEQPERRFQRALYELGCSLNGLRNKDGTGHGRPWVASVTPVRARMSVEATGLVAGYLLDALTATQAIARS